MSTPKVDFTLTSQGHHLAFSKEVLEVAHIFRRVGSENGSWQRVAINTRLPFTPASFSYNR